MSEDIPQLQGLEKIACYEDREYNPYFMIQDNILNALPKAILTIELEEAKKPSKEHGTQYTNISLAFEEFRDVLRENYQNQEKHKKTILKLFQANNKNNNPDAQQEREKTLAKAYEELSNLLPAKEQKSKESITIAVYAINEAIAHIPKERKPSKKFAKAFHYINLGLQDTFNETNVLRNNLALEETYNNTTNFQKKIFPYTSNIGSEIKEFGNTTKEFIDTFYALGDFSYDKLAVEYSYTRHNKSFCFFSDISKKVRKKRNWR